MQHSAQPHNTHHKPHTFIPLRVEYVPVRLDPEELVGVGDGVQVGVLSIQEEGVRLPDLIQHLDAGPQDVQVTQLFED